jgi:hypothetical protein
MREGRDLHGHGHNMTYRGRGLVKMCNNNNNNNGSSYIAHFTNVQMRFTISGGLFRAGYYGAIGSQAAYNHER